MTRHEDDMDLSIFFGGLLIGIILTLTLSSLVWSFFDLELKREAVVKNCAEWVVNEYGRTTFKFKDYADKKNLAEKD